MPSSTIAAVLGLAAVARTQQVGTYQSENHPSLSWQTCTARNSCTTRSGRVVIDANWRWVHSTSGYTNCYTGNTWDISLCPNDVICAQNCALEGADYSGTYGVTTSGNSMTLRFVTQTANRNVGSRLYLMETDDRYQILNLLGQEISFDVDTSQLPCGLNGAVYLVSMDADGGMSRYSGNRAGARYGTGYCDSQCPRDLKFINGQGNSEGWQPSSNDPNAGVGNHGSCCAEMDIWEANSISAAYTPHPCSNNPQHMCQGDACGGTYSSTRYAGDCDPDGCDFNSYRQGNTTFYGPGRAVNTNSRFTVVTQFITSDGSTTGTLSEIRRFYVQNGRLIPNSQSTISGVTGNSITTNYCNAQKTTFNDDNYFSQRGGMSGMGNALRNGMVLVMSVWDDHYANMLWLDSNYPLTRSASSPGVARGTCPTTSGVPTDVEAASPNAQVIYSNIRTGPVNSTFTAT